MTASVPTPLRRLAAAAVLAALSSGCSWLTSWAIGTDNSAPPAELVSIANPISIQRVWDVSIGDGAGKAFVRLQPAFDGDALYAAARDGDVAAIDAATGNKRWTRDTDLAISGGVGAGAGIVVIGSSKGEIVALRQADGAVAWKAQVSSEVLAPPRIGEGIVLVRVADGRFFAFDAASGRQLWNYAASVPLLSLRGASAPLIGQGIAIAGLDNGRLLLLDLKSGRPVFERTLAPPRGKTEMDRLVDVDAEPRIAGSVLYIAPFHGAVTAIDLSNGSTLWNRDISTYAGLDVSPQQVFVTAADDTVWALDRASGSALWKNADLSGRKLSAPVAAGSVVAVGDFEGYIHFLDANTGRLVGRVELDGKGIMGTPLVRNGMLFAYGKGGKLAGYRPGGG